MITGELVEAEAEGDLVTWVLLGVGLGLAGGVVGAVVVGAVVGSAGSVVGSGGSVGMVGGVVGDGRPTGGRFVGSPVGGRVLLVEGKGCGDGWISLVSAAAYCG